MQVPDVTRTVAALRERVGTWRRAGDRIALVPTMGALHDGHLALVRRAREEAERVVVTIFVNPKQFGPAEDFGRYPRTEERDRALLAGLADLVFAPSGETMYPPGFGTTVSVAGPSAGLEGDVRPGHFDGMATVVAKLFIQAQADLAVFGEKDWQQLQIVRLMVRDLDLPLRVVPHPVVRDAHGLALSSRNLRLSEGELAVARSLNRVLADVRDALRHTAVEEALAAGRRALAEGGFGPLDYLALVEPETLRPLPALPAGRSARLLAAVRVGDVRLLDNVEVPAPSVRDQTGSAPVNRPAS
ncbi:pantoate--beta-alanine ligase [Enterovirga sp.]|uniref:pantoate--beta-alanine ligase n=1 Tax=Enterovirga sp. TaxID=2026350 RepID=UPI002632EBDD|nr:pantoate--beta-alanine ligase [Enterovirga sp.]MDB5590443.1 panC [Enterovirga sp.]